ncbi:MAG: heavy metal translocating P-type ATPase [bacterium JZ-2024 1]
MNKKGKIPSFSTARTIEFQIKGMDCASCTAKIKKELEMLPGVLSAEVFLGAEKALVHFEPSLVDFPTMKRVVENLGYSVGAGEEQARQKMMKHFSRKVLVLLGWVFGAVLVVVVVGEWLGYFEKVHRFIPGYIAIPVALVAGYPILSRVISAALSGRVLAHTLMSVGFLTALAVGEWPAALVVLFFMYVGSYTEQFTVEGARKAVKELTRMQPRTARLEKDNREIIVPVEEVQVGDIVLVRPGEQIPVDGEVVEGTATVNQATITGESLPVEVYPGSRVFASTFALMGSVKVKAQHIGPDSTFGKIIRLVEQAEARRAEVQRVADRFSGYYLPVVLAVALFTYLIRKDVMSAASVLVVSCSCAFAIATPVAILASIGASARRGLLIKGGKYLELLARPTVVLLDKTGTLTFGKPKIVEIVPLNQCSEEELLSLAASAERYSEHPLAEAIREEARRRNVPLFAPRHFTAFPGLGVKAEVNGKTVLVGNRKMLSQENYTSAELERMEREGKTPIFVSLGEQIMGILAASDTLRPEVPQAIQKLKSLGVLRVEILTGDNERVADFLSSTLGIPSRANLLPEEKISIVRDYQKRGNTVVMVGDGVNDAPALAQADVGIAMGFSGSDIALEAAHIVVMKDDWRLIPEVFRIARKTMNVVKLNIGFTAIFNLVFLSLASLGYLPVIFAAALQSLPDLGILFNSSRLLKQ